MTFRDLLLARASHLLFAGRLLERAKSRMSALGHSLPAGPTCLLWALPWAWA